MIKLRPTEGVIIVPSYTDNREKEENLIHRHLVEHPVPKFNNQAATVLLDKIGIEVGQELTHNDVKLVWEKAGAFLPQLEQMLLHCIYHGCVFEVIRE